MKNVNIYRLKPKNRAKITKDSPGDISPKLNCISHEENAVNRTQSMHS